MNVPVYFPAVTVAATENPQVESTRAFKPTRLCVCSIKEAAVLRSVKSVGLRLAFKARDVAQLMLKVSRSPWLSRPRQLSLALCCSGLPGVGRDLAGATAEGW